MSNVECESCVKRKTMYCPNSFKCYATKDKPYWQNRIMLLEENNQLKEKYVDAVADYEEQKFNVEELKKQLENKYSRTGTLTNEVLYEENTKLINQQKEFIEYLEDKIKFSTKPTTCILLKSILQNYKKIIGGKDE